ncbi:MULTISPECIES: hypothetical protein [unclassified Iodidimonas]|uniref:hypothetical protein n=1 Tax=unclassified Iodidimonas TaxID=2626145 RepID=UPI002482B448|nr:MULTISPECIES: hypothetical protein [unclassified Iodidimonas]
MQKSLALQSPLLPISPFRSAMGPRTLPYGGSGGGRIHHQMQPPAIRFGSLDRLGKRCRA